MSTRSERVMDPDRPTTRAGRDEVSLRGTSESLVVATASLESLRRVDARTLQVPDRQHLYDALRAMEHLEARLMARAYNLEHPPLPGLPGLTPEQVARLRDT